MIRTKKFYILILLISIITQFPSCIIGQNPNLSFKILKQSPEGILQSLEISINDYSFESKIGFIYLSFGNLKENDCEILKINFKLDESENSNLAKVNKGVVLESFINDKLVLDLSEHQFRKINALFLYYSDIKGKYYPAVYYKNTKYLLEEIDCESKNE